MQEGEQEAAIRARPECEISLPNLFFFFLVRLCLPPQIRQDWCLSHDESRTRFVRPKPAQKELLHRLSRSLLPAQACDLVLASPTNRTELVLFPTLSPTPPLHSISPLNFVAPVFAVVKLPWSCSFDSPSPFLLLPPRSPPPPDHFEPSQPTPKASSATTTDGTPCAAFLLPAPPSHSTLFPHLPPSTPQPTHTMDGGGGFFKGTTSEQVRLLYRSRPSN